MPTGDHAPDVDEDDAPSLARAKDWLQIVQSAATVFALIVGAVWALYIYGTQREAQPQLDIDHAITALRLTPDYRWVHLTVIHKNRGKSLVQLSSADIRLQRVLPLPKKVQSRLDAKEDPVIADDAVVRWPLLCRRTFDKALELEPNETHEATYEFVIPAYVETIKVYTYFPNEARSNEIGWAKASIHSFKTDGERSDEAADPDDTGRSDNICARDL